jgi:hypothetical protein
MAFASKKKAQEYHRKYRATNRERIKEYYRKYYANNIERRKKSYHDYYLKNKSKIQLREFKRFEANENKKKEVNR